MAKRSEYQQSYYAANRDKCLAQMKQWRIANKERKAETDRRWREANRERIASKCRAYNERNSETLKQKHHDAYIRRRYADIDASRAKEREDYKKHRERKLAEGRRFRDRNKDRLNADARDLRRRYPKTQEQREAQKERMKCWRSKNYEREYKYRQDVRSGKRTPKPIEKPRAKNPAIVRGKRPAWADDCEGKKLITRLQNLRRVHIRDDGYIARLESDRTPLSPEQVPQELIDAKRQQLWLRREMRGR